MVPEVSDILVGEMRRSGFVLVGRLLVLLFLLGGPSAGRVNQNEVITDGWVTPAGDPVNLIDLAATPGWTDEGITIQRRLPGYIESGSEFNFLSVNCTLKLYYDDELAYTFEPDPDKYGKAYCAEMTVGDWLILDELGKELSTAAPAKTATSTSNTSNTTSNTSAAR